MEASIFEAGYQSTKVAITDSISTQSLPGPSDKEFEQLFKQHFKSLYAYAYTILKDEAQAEETVQNVFFKVWDKKLIPTIRTSVKAYLYKAVYHESLNHLKHRKIRTQYQQHAMRHHNNQAENVSKKVVMKELEEKLRDAMNALPQQCRTIFQMSRFDGLK